jgi:glutaredoxin-related protein
MSDSTRRRIEDIIASGDVILFMKGIPAAPQCGFSAAVVQILSQLAVPFKSVDVLSDLEVRVRTGRPSRSFMSRASSLAAATSFGRCIRQANSRRC